MREKGEIREIFLKRKFLILSLSRRGYEVVHEEKPKENTTRSCRIEEADPPTPVLQSPPGFPNADLQYEDVLDTVQKLHSELGLITLENDKDHLGGL